MKIRNLLYTEIKWNKKFKSIESEGFIESIENDKIQMCHITK